SYIWSLRQSTDTTWQEGTRRSSSLVGESSIGLEIVFYSSVLSLEGKDQVGEEMKQSTCHRVVSRSCTILPNDSNCKYDFILVFLVHLERVNPSPFPTHSARESEWAKAEVVLNVMTRCSREIELIW
ncbi:hypothetical protein H5410_045309, partial [Solanum commersonii]